MQGCCPPRRVRETKRGTHAEGKQRLTHCKCLSPCVFICKSAFVHYSTFCLFLVLVAQGAVVKKLTKQLAEQSIALKNQGSDPIDEIDLSSMAPRAAASPIRKRRFVGWLQHSPSHIHPHKCCLWTFLAHPCSLCCQ